MGQPACHNSASMRTQPGQHNGAWLALRWRAQITPRYVPRRRRRWQGGAEEQRGSLTTAPPLLRPRRQCSHAAGSTGAPRSRQQGSAPPICQWLPHATQQWRRRVVQVLRQAGSFQWLPRTTQHRRRRVAQDWRQAGGSPPTCQWLPRATQHRCRRVAQASRQASGAPSTPPLRHTALRQRRRAAQARRAVQGWSAASGAASSRSGRCPSPCLRRLPSRSYAPLPPARRRPATRTPWRPQLGRAGRLTPQRRRLATRRHCHATRGMLTLPPAVPHQHRQQQQPRLWLTCLLGQRRRHRLVPSPLHGHRRRCCRQGALLQQTLRHPQARPLVMRCGRSCHRSWQVRPAHLTPSLPQR